MKEAIDKARELYEEINFIDNPVNGVYTMTHHQRKQCAVKVAKEILVTLNSPPIKHGSENSMLWKATVDYWNNVLIECKNL